MILYLFLLLPRTTLAEVKVFKFIFLFKTIKQQNSIENTPSPVSQICDELNVILAVIVIIIN